MSGLSRIVQQYTAGSSPVGRLPAALLLDMALYIVGLLLVSASRLTALTAAADYSLDDSLLLFSAETVSRLCCALSAEQQAALYDSLLPLLRDGSGESLMAAFNSAAARLTDTGADAIAMQTSGAAPEHTATFVSLLSVTAAPTASLRQLLCVVCPALSCYRPVSEAALAVEQPWLVQHIICFLSAPSLEAPTDSSRSAVIHLAACIVNKLPADSPLLTALVQSLLEQYALELLEQRVQYSHDTAKQQPGSSATSDVVHRVAVAACLLKALSLRRHPIAAALLLRYVRLPSLVDEAGSAGEVSAVLQRWSDGFALLISDFPLLLSRASHALVVGTVLLFRQRLLTTLLPPLQQQIAQRQNERRQRAKQRLQIDDTTVGGPDESLPYLLLATMQLAVHVPYHVAAQCMDQLLPLTASALASSSSLCQIAGLRTLHSFLSQQQPLSSAALPLSTSALSQLSVHLPSIVPVLLTLLRRQTNEPPRLDDELRALDCLSALRSLPFSSLFPFRSRVLSVLAECADREERAIRRQAIRVRNEWSSTD